MILGWRVQAIEKTLNNQAFLHAVMGACCNVFLESLPSFRNGFIRELLKARDLTSEGIGFAHREILRQECIGASFPCGQVCFVGVKLRLRLAYQGEREQSKTNIIHRGTSRVDGAAHFQEVLEVSVGIL